MPTYKVRGTRKTVTLDQTNFRAKGGEGSIYVVGDTVYKVVENGRMLDDAKIAELAALDHPRIVKPEAVLLDDSARRAGYTMRLVPGRAVPLAQILSKAFREREGVTPSHMADLVGQIAEAVRSIHSHPGYLQVDGNELNYMVTDTFDEVYLIDVNSYQTPSFPADAIMPSIRDWSLPEDPSTGLPRWSQLSDWYSFAIVSFYMFTGIHPFKGRHPRFPNLREAMVDQMRAGVSVLDPETKFPVGAVYHPFESVVPGGKAGAYMGWYRSVLAEGLRLPPPDSFQAVAKFAALVREVSGSDKFVITELRDYGDSIVGFYAKNGREVVVTTAVIYVDGAPKAKPPSRLRVGFAASPVAAWLEGDLLRLTNLDSGSDIPTQIRAVDIMSCEGRLYTLYGDSVNEVCFVDVGSTTAFQKAVASVMPNATQLFQGVALQDMFGSTIASVFPKEGHHQQVKLPELDPYRVTDAKYEAGVLMAVGVHKETGQNSRFVFRFSADWSSYDAREVDNITPSGLNFTVPDNGVCVCLTEEECVEIFPSSKGSPHVKSIDDPSIEADMRLCHSGSQVRFARGGKLYSISVKK